MAKTVTPGRGGGPPPAADPDAHGQAALMLVESLLHALVDVGTFTTKDAIDVIAVAQAVKTDLGHASGEAPATIARSLHLLDQIAISFNADLQ